MVVAPKDVKKPKPDIIKKEVDGVKINMNLTKLMETMTNKACQHTSWNCCKKLTKGRKCKIPKKYVDYFNKDKTGIFI